MGVIGTTRGQLDDRAVEVVHGGLVHSDGAQGGIRTMASREAMRWSRALRSGYPPQVPGFWSPFARRTAAARRQGRVEAPAGAGPGSGPGAASPPCQR